MHDFVAKVQQAVANGRLLKKGSRVVLGVSGGADSVALLHAFAQLKNTWQFKIIVAHLDHGLRASSEADARFVEALAETLKVPCVFERWPVCELCEKQGWSLEEGARRLRYQFLEGVAQQYGADSVVVAHTADDQAETVLLRLLRGSGLAGLSAIPLKRELGAATLIRPLLGLWRLDVVAYLQSIKAIFREDESNKDTRFVRNRIRHELIPLLQESFNPRVRQALVQLATQAQDDDAYLQAAAARQWKRTVKPLGKNRLAIRLSQLRRHPVALQRQLIRRAIRLVKGDLRSFEFRHWLEVQELIYSRPNASVVHLPGGIAVTRVSAAELLLAPGKAAGYTNSLSRTSTLTEKAAKDPN